MSGRIVGASFLSIKGSGCVGSKGGDVLLVGQFRGALGRWALEISACALNPAKTSNKSPQER
jgi:hypothetical protein